jgi:hypothetical protein
MANAKAGCTSANGDRLIVEALQESSLRSAYRSGARRVLSPRDINTRPRDGPVLFEMGRQVDPTLSCRSFTPYFFRL